MAKYCIEIEVPSELSTDSRVCHIHMALDKINSMAYAIAIANLEVDDQLDIAPGLLTFRTE